ELAFAFAPRQSGHEAPTLAMPRRQTKRPTVRAGAIANAPTINQASEPVDQACLNERKLMTSLRCTSADGDANHSLGMTQVPDRSVMPLQGGAVRPTRIVGPER